MPFPSYPTSGSSPWDTTLKTYIDAGTAGTGAVIGPSNGSDDTATINAALLANAGKVVRGTPGQTYLISAPLIVYSATVLDMTDCAVTLIAASNCNMLQNRAAATPNRTITDGAITTGTNLFNSPAQANFTTADVGRSVIIPGAGLSAASLVATITARNSATQVVLNMTASTTVSAQTVPIYTRDNSIIIRGGAWSRGANGGTFNAAHSLFLRRVDNLLIENFTYTSTAGKFAIAMADVNSYEVRNIYSAQNFSDSVHVTGPATDGLIENIEIVVGGDDVVGLTTTDFTGYDDVHGDIDQLTIRNVAGSAATRIVLIAGSANGTADGFQCKNILVEQIRQYGAGDGVYLGSIVAGTAMTHDDIMIRGVRGGRVYLRAPHMGQIVVENVLAPPGAPAVNLTPEAAPQNNNIIDRLTLKNCRATSSTASTEVFAASNSISVIGQLEMYDCAALGAPRLADFLCSTVTSARFHNCEVTSTLDPVIVNAAGCTIAQMTFDSLRGNLPTTGTHFVKLSAGAITTLTYNDPQLTAVDNTSGSLLFVNSTSATIGKMNVRGGRLDAIRNVLDHQSTGTGVITYLNVADTHFAAVNRIFQASNVTLNFDYSNVQYISGVNEPARIYGGGALNVRGFGWAGRTSSCVVRAAAEVIHVIAQDFPADAAILTGAAGDTFTNTNTGANPFVAGPLIRDQGNAYWAHEQGYVAAGTVTLVAGTATVSNTNITANAVIQIWRTTTGGTPGHLSYVLNAGTNFVINATGGADTSVIRYEIERY